MNVGEECIDEDSLRRARIIASRLKKGKDKEMKQVIESFDCPASKYPKKEQAMMGIYDRARDYIMKQKIEPKFVFAHPEILKKYPQTSMYYRGISTLPLKRAQKIVPSIKKWEDGKSRNNNFGDCLRISCLYNATISAIVMDSTDWTLENGYRNILATLGIAEDGKIRNLIGSRGENLVRGLIFKWFKEEESVKITTVEKDKEYKLEGNNRIVTMKFSSEPDVSFEMNDRIIATIEIKSGTDPAGALERLGAIKKSFEETPTHSKNFAVLGVITREMENRMQDMHIEDHFVLKNIESDPANFLNEVFHHALRLTSTEIDRTMAMRCLAK